MARTEWHVENQYGRQLHKLFLKMSKKANTEGIAVKDLVSISNSMGQLTMQIINVKTSSITTNKVEKIEKLLSYIPKEVMIKALESINEQK